MAREQIEAFMREFNVTVEATFVPWSKSRSYSKEGEKNVTKRNLNWRVTVKRDGREVVACDYSAGIAYAPSYKTHSGRLTIDVAEAIEYETNVGKAARRMPGAYSKINPYGGAPILPDPCDVLASLMLDASVLDARSFEDWASELGYDTDSRKAEGIYRACLNIALKLRNGLAENGLRALQTATEDY